MPAWSQDKQRFSDPLCPPLNASPEFLLALQARADVEHKLEAVDLRLRAAAEKERDLDQRQAALLEKVRNWGVLSWGPDIDAAALLEEVRN